MERTFILATFALSFSYRFRLHNTKSSVLQIDPTMKAGAETQMLLAVSIIVFAGAIFISLDIVNNVWPCELCSGNVKTVTLASAYLYSGNLSTSSSNATASFTFSLNNPGSTTFITSLTISSNGVTTISNWYNGTRSQTIVNSINGTLIAYVPGSGSKLTITQWADNSLASVPSNNVNFSSSNSNRNTTAIYDSQRMTNRFRT